MLSRKDTGCHAVSSDFFEVLPSMISIDFLHKEENWPLKLHVFGLVTFSVNTLFAMIAIAFCLSVHPLNNDTSTKFPTKLKDHSYLNKKPTTASNFVLAPWGAYEKWFASFKTSLTLLTLWMLSFKF